MEAAAGPPVSAAVCTGSEGGSSHIRPMKIPTATSSTAAGLALSPTGLEVYAAGAGDDELAIFRRHRLPRELRFERALRHAGGDLAGLAVCAAAGLVGAVAAVVHGTDQVVVHLVCGRDLGVEGGEVRKWAQLPLEPGLIEKGLVRDPAQVTRGQDVSVRVAKGRFSARVTDEDQERS